MTTHQNDRPIISADSHVIEPIEELWGGLLPEDFWGEDAAETFAQRPGGFDPNARIEEMGVDRVSAEVLYPSLAMRLFTLEDPSLQQTCFRKYNRWLADYCSVSPKRLIGVGLIPAYDMDVALAETEWCHDNGLRGVQLWQTPPAELPFSGQHYEPLWAACSDLELPVSLHILTGFDYSQRVYAIGPELATMGELLFKLAITHKVQAAMDTLLELILSGPLDRHPRLRIVTVENEVAWLPFFLDQLDYYYDRYNGKSQIQTQRPPSETFRDQIFATFFRDPNTKFVAEKFGGRNIMWSSDYPHGNSTWPNSQEVIADRLGALPDDLVHRIVWDNVNELFGLGLEASAPVSV